MEWGQGERLYPEKEKALPSTATSGDIMFTLFQRKRSASAPMAPTETAVKGKGLMRPESAASLLATPRRQKLLEHIWQRTSLSRTQFTVLYSSPLERYAELVQHFPASESHHHAYPGGMLDHGLEIVAYALKLRQSHLLPAGTTPEDQVAQAEAWTAAVAYAALLHDIGKIAVDLHVEYADGNTWHPWHGPLLHPYRFRYRKEREYRLHSAATGLLYNRLLDAHILDWLSDYPALWSSLLYVLAGQYEHAGVLGELITQADRASVAQALGGDPAKAMAAPKHALQRKLLEGLRFLLKEELRLNQPQASDGWLTQDALWLVSKTVSDKLRAHLLSRGIDGIPANNTAVFNVLQDHGMLQPTEAGKAIWKATVTSDAGWSHTFTLLRLAPALIWEPSERPASFQGSVTVETIQAAEADANPLPAQVSPEMATPAICPPPETGTQRGTEGDQPDALEELLSMIRTPEMEASPPSPDTSTVPEPMPLIPQSPAPMSVPSAFLLPLETAGSTAEHLMTWLKQSIVSRRLIINDARALVHTVSGTVFLVTPGIFQRYAQEHPEVGALARQEKQQDWEWIQRCFDKSLLHRKQNNGLNIWTCEVTGPRKSRRLHGYLLQEPKQLFDEIPPNNPYLTVINGNAISQISSMP